MFPLCGKIGHHKLGKYFSSNAKIYEQRLNLEFFVLIGLDRKWVSQWSDCGVHIINLYMLHISCTGVTFRLLSSKCHCFISFLKNSYGICSKFTIKTQEGRHWGTSGVFIVNFEQVHTLICFHSWLWKRKCWLYSFLSFEVFQESLMASGWNFVWEERVFCKKAVLLNTQIFFSIPLSNQQIPSISFV